MILCGMDGWVGGLLVRGQRVGDCKRYSETEALVHAGSYVYIGTGNNCRVTIAWCIAMFGFAPQTLLA